MVLICFNYIHNNNKKYKSINNNKIYNNNNKIYNKIWKNKKIIN